MPRRAALAALARLTGILAVAALAAGMATPGHAQGVTQGVAQSVAQGVTQGTVQGVALAGQIGRRKALLLVDGRPLTLAVGEARQGVRLRALGDGSAEVEIGGRVRVLRQGDAPLRLDGDARPAGAGGREVVLPMGPGGHFLGSGAINGRAVRFMVDTGASVVALSAAEAARIGVDLDAAVPVVIGTANGTVTGRRITLSAVTLGEVTVANVAAVVTPAPMSHVLLGNSFLQRFQLRRDNDVMRLQLR